MHEKNAKIVCLVPSWTETLLFAGLNVVGRTRFCIHPEDLVSKIPAVGGTKSFKLEEIIALKPEFVILDKEENKKEMAESLSAHGVNLLVSHVSCLSDASDFLKQLSEIFNSETLSYFSDQYKILSAHQNQISREKFLAHSIIKKNSELQLDHLEYIIWKNPYMAIGAKTFIADVFNIAGLKLLRSEKYPVVSEADIKAKYCLFSSEPYPFAKDFEHLTQQGFKAALIDGEKISWYGLRNLRFLESCSD
jgi:ABC-type Fe3+-hydroxamate transport system substrate-binding protein